MISVCKADTNGAGYKVLCNGIEIERKPSKKEAMEQGQAYAKRYGIEWEGLEVRGKKRNTNHERSLFTGRHK